jgi:hypothetical protein
MEDFKGKVLFASAKGRPDKGKLMLEFRLDSFEAFERDPETVFKETHC